MRVTNCIFCGVLLKPSRREKPDSRTDEHVYARWYRDNVVNQKIKMFTSDGTTATMHRQPSLEAFVNSAVCRECNSGWMSTLETQVDPIFEKLTNGTDISVLTPEEVETLARWAGKTAIVLGYVTPISAIVPQFIRRTFLPQSTTPPHMRLFYGFIKADLTLEGGYLQLSYGAEIPVIGSEGGSGHRFTLCLFNHCFTVDFPPILAGVRYDLRDSCSAQIWPYFVPAGTTELSIPTPAPIGDVLLAICKRVQVCFDISALHV
jgi:hypothetical protein